MARVALLIALVALLASPARAEVERRLVMAAGPNHAAGAPDLDGTVYQVSSWKVEGADLSPFQGLPVRILGDWQEGKVVVSRPAPGQEPPVVAAPRTARRGRWQAEALDGATARLEVGSGRSATVQVEHGQAAGARFTLVATVVDGRALDFRVEPPLQASAWRGPVRFVVQMTEGFLNRSVDLYRRAHPEQFAWSSAVSRFEVDALGLTLLGCEPGQVRLYGSLKGQVTLLGETAGQWEVVARPAFHGAELDFQLVPGTLRLRMTRPLFVPVPAGWSGALQALLSGVDLRAPVPGAYWKEMVASGVVTAADLSRLEVLTLPTGDRSTGLLVVAGPVDSAGGGPDLLRDRTRHPATFAVALSDAAMDEVLARNVPPLLPIRRKLPPEARVSQQVLIFKLVVDEVEITSLSLDWDRGAVGIRELVARVHWEFGGLMSGWEPGVRLQGRARVASRAGPPLSMLVYPEVSELEILSPNVRRRPAEEQEAIRRRIVEGIQGLPLDVLLPSQMPVADVGGVLELVDFEASSEGLVLQGRWMP